MVESNRPGGLQQRLEAHDLLGEGKVALVERVGLFKRGHEIE